MFGFLKSPVEQRVFPYIWPRIEEVKIAIPPDHPAMKQEVPLQATTAIANLALAATLLFQNLSREKAQAATSRIESLIFQRIAADHAYYTVSSVLKLPSEQTAWRMQMAGADASTQSNLDTIIRTVHWIRIEKYQEECRKGILMVMKNGGRTAGYGVVGFLAKRWLSEITGRPILRDDDLSEEGFDDLGLTSFYFSRVLISLGNELKR